MPAIREVARTVHPRWGLVALASLVVLLTYALLIESWRLVLEALGGTLARGPAAVIWLGSSLARYLPLAGWQVGVMALMAKRRNVPVAVSAATSIVITVTNLITGLLVFSVASSMTLASSTVPTEMSSRVWLVVAGVVALLIAPLVLPRLAAITRAISGRELVIPKISARPIGIALAGTAAAWVLYGLAFYVLTQSIFPDPSRSVMGCIALYTGSYIAGLLAIVPPAGLGAAEFAMVQLSERLGMFGGPEAAVLAIVVRVWRTVLEIVPGVLVLGLTSILERDRERSGADA